MFITSSRFSPGAKELADKHNIILVDGDDYCGIVNSFISNGCSNVLGVSSLAINSIGIGKPHPPK